MKGLRNINKKVSPRNLISGDKNEGDEVDDRLVELGLDQSRFCSGAAFAEVRQLKFDQIYLN